MPHEQVSVIGIVAGVITLAASMRYWYAIWVGKAKPNRASYIIWTILQSVVSVTYVLNGARASAVVPVVLALSLYPVVPLAVYTGNFERGWSRLDKVCLALTGVGLVVWAVTGSPLLTLVWMMTIDVVGTAPTARKAWCDPLSEDRAAWSIVTVGQVLNLGAVEEWRFGLLVYPVVSIVICVTIAAPLWLRRQPATPCAAP